jgi:hypothetical protein
MRALERVIKPEILDNLSPDDPRAIRSRQDLCVIDAILGNSRWITAQLQSRAESRSGIVEIGAGSGALCNHLHKRLPDTPITGLDFVSRPPTLAHGIQWKNGDFFDTLPGLHGGACIGSLILHHFAAGVLREIGRRIAHFPLLVFCEPLRSPLPLAISNFILPLVSEVTQHDMPASICAGFQKGELPFLLGLDPQKWHVQESSTWRGSLRLLAWRC